MHAAQPGSVITLMSLDNHYIIVGAQTKGQFHMIYGTEGTRALFAGLATQIVYGGCDHDTADFYSKASGTTTADANPDPQKANFRQRPLLKADDDRYSHDETPGTAATIRQDSITDGR